MTKNRLHTKEEAEQAEKPKRKNRIGKWLVTVLSGEYLTREGVVKHVPFVLFVTALFACNIAWVYYSENLIRENNATHRKLDELRSEYNTIITQLENRSGQTQVASDVQSLGLEESVLPPVIIDLEPNELASEQ